MKDKDKPCTWYIVEQAMKDVSKYVRSPKCVRDGLVKPTNNNNQQS